MDKPPALDEHGHYPGCRTHGCAATRCADARWMAEFARARRLEAEASQRPPHLSPSGATSQSTDRETKAIANAAAVLLNEGARDTALELLAATRRR